MTMSPMNDGVLTFLTFFMILPMMNWCKRCQTVLLLVFVVLTASKAAVLHIPRKILPIIAFAHRIGIGSDSVLRVSIRPCMSSLEKTLSKVALGFGASELAVGMGEAACCRKAWYHCSILCAGLCQSSPIADNPLELT